MQAQEIHAAIRTVKREIARWPDPVVGVVARQSKNRKKEKKRDKYMKKQKDKVYKKM